MGPRNWHNNGFFGDYRHNGDVPSKKKLKMKFSEKFPPMENFKAWQNYISISLNYCITHTSENLKLNKICSTFLR